MADFTNLVDLFEDSAEKHADRELFGTKTSAGWTYVTYSAFKDLVDRVRGALAACGINPGDRVAIVSDNRVEWAAAAYAAYGRGAAAVPMYESQSPADWEFILNDCGAKVVFASTAAVYERLQAARPRLTAEPRLIGFDLPADHPDAFKAHVERGWQDDRSSLIVPAAGELAAVLYTSGTTGKPKGVVLTHGNICSNVNAVRGLFDLRPSDRALSFLPWAHAFGQTCELHVLVATGASMAINDSVPHLVSNLAEVRPTLLYAVPRIWNRLYENVHRQMAEKPPVVRALFRAGVRNAARKRRGHALSPLSALSVTLADRLVFSKIRERLGGRLRYVVSGSAALNPEVLEFIDAIGIDLYEGYGLTETSPIVSANTPQARKLGSVGRPIPGVRVSIDAAPDGDGAQGEIIVFGPNVMRGYLNRPEETSAVLTPEGGLRTGDLGRVDEDGFLYVTGRIKEQYKLENGKYVVPGPLEDTLRLSPYIANVVLFGDNRPYNVALVVPEVEAITAWARERNLDLGADLIHHPEVIRLIHEELEQRSSSFKSYERPRRFSLVSDDFTQENGLLTPTLKVKRARVVETYEGTLRGLYAAPPSSAVPHP